MLRCDPKLGVRPIVSSDFTDIRLEAGQTSAIRKGERFQSS